MLTDAILERVERITRSGTTSQISIADSSLLELGQLVVDGDCGGAWKDALGGCPWRSAPAWESTPHCVDEVERPQNRAARARIWRTTSLRRGRSQPIASPIGAGRAEIRPYSLRRFDLVDTGRGAIPTPGASARTSANASSRRSASPSTDS